MIQSRIIVLKSHGGCVIKNKIMCPTSWGKVHRIRFYSFKVWTMFPVFAVGQVLNLIVTPYRHSSFYCCAFSENTISY